MRFLVIASLVVCAACSPEGGGPDTSPGDSDAADGAGGDDGGDRGPDGPPGDTAPPLRDDRCTTGYWVTRLTGRVQDEAGAPLEAVKAQACIRHALLGQLYCLYPSTTAADGQFAIDISANELQGTVGVRCAESSVMRVMLPGADRATAYHVVDLTSGLAEIDVGSITLHATATATALPPRGDGAVSRTVTFDSGLELDVVPDTFFGPLDGYERLASRQVAADDPNLFRTLDAAAFEALYAFSPEGDISGSAGYPLRFPNTTALPAGTLVNLYLLGGLSCALADGTLVHEGQWALFGSAQVSADQSVIAGDPLPCLNWFAYAVQP